MREEGHNRLAQWEDPELIKQVAKQVVFAACSLYFDIT